MKAASAAKAQSVEAYVKGFPPAVRARLSKIREAIRKAVPQSEESISYNMPAYKFEGRPLIYFAAFKAHIGLYPITAEVKAAFAKELEGYAQSTGTVRIPHEARLPIALIARIAKFRAKALSAKRAAKAKPAKSAFAARKR